MSPFSLDQPGWVLVDLAQEQGKLGQFLKVRAFITFARLEMALKQQHLHHQGD